MKALILAAGMGTRLRPLTDRIPKAMAPVQDGLPLLEHLVRHLQSQGILDFVINLHYLPECIVSHFGDGQRFGVRIEYSDETGCLLDTAGAVRKAAPLLGDEFLLVYGDQLHFFDFRPLVELHRQNGSLATLVLKRSDLPQNGDLAELDGSGRITGWHARPHDRTEFTERLYLNSGLYVLSQEIVDYIPDGGPVSLDRQVLPGLIRQGHSVSGLAATDEILDIGTAEKYAHARQWFAQKMARKRRALFLDRDGVIFREFPRGEYITDWDQVVIADEIRPVVDAARAAGYLTVVVTNQPQISRRLLTEGELHGIHERMNAALDQKLDAIYYCPHTDADRCACRKPNPGLLSQASRDWNISLEESIMVGDSNRDIDAGNSAGCRTIFVRHQYNAGEAARCSPGAVVDRVSEIESLL
jgi:mannose-1-phosphate guanylyltransferase / phosphomannomutase